MRKLKLDVDDLTVDSFDAVGGPKESGTVRGQDSESWDYCETNDPRLRMCYTPYLECDTVRWTCNTYCYLCDTDPSVCDV